MSKNSIWYLAGPFHQYKEDVKALAKEHGLRIVDANATNDRDGEAKDVPDVTIKEAPKVLIVDGASSGADAEVFRAELALISAITESFTRKDLSRPDGELGPVAESLFQTFDAVNHGVQSLRNERDGEAEKVIRLQKQVDDLQLQIEKTSQADAEAKEIADLKAKLDAANVTYRVNASKESLQKQVDELGKP
ncbi:hypothetical protein [Pseudomonas syringae]|uniref:Uncharacterized protein n=1 Tax=Pseudomonas syringae pv. pisi str. 1704B TaxID=629263 RepID=F3G898_PSESJ|nr:hypothetical protein [Pseudomonas syringae]EGH43298.1 hypothetical protein PSYPI_13251 [Pseudomonas syringae pv. pisi str. 1704B]PYD15845.1 hypothetical protein DND62_06800 [Pseudomonas syringae pv. pisi]PYD34357.1 hypothetical protein DND58_01755 [Pseudomonas syringae pv. pisi]RML58331.1 hypothetical protein ALQ93_00343 [Pseudomonas syringae pv. pisi]RMM20530.1 hypothetical protein ALQ82_02459 [Pseudomonas syringae pv. pisi]